MIKYLKHHHDQRDEKILQLWEKSSKCNFKDSEHAGEKNSYLHAQDWNWTPIFPPVQRSTPN